MRRLVLGLAGLAGLAFVAIVPGADPDAIDLTARLALPGAMHENLEQLKDVVTKDPRVAAQVIKSWVGDA